MKILKDTGGPAFASGAVRKARARPGDAGSDWIEAAREEPANPGMTLRDYFAAKAMQSFIEQHVDAVGDDHLAEESYRVADAMLKARKA